MLHLIAIIASAVVLIAGYLLCRLKQANNEINRLFETNKTLQAEQKIGSYTVMDSIDQAYPMLEAIKVEINHTFRLLVGRWACRLSAPLNSA
ncbi:hypothetical protein JFL51_08170 [Histophilus somni]|uniref:hypothetical protein n=1 Tax=Histophilus somni TaxID=731 RepID=UPI0018ECCF6A|nr:hypothetical protein [Histophilus somni]QQF80326.1 hypothetical protein JFL51_08170 [Histophilus somni]